MALTFDDGYSCWISNVLPILTSNNLTASAYINNPDVVDNVDITWEGIHQLYEAGWEIGWHTAQHIELDITDSAIITRDLASAAALFESHGLPPPETFAYPKGKYDNDSMEIVSRYFIAARTVHAGVNTPCDVLDRPHHLKTMKIHNQGKGIPYIKEQVKEYINQGVFITLYTHTVGDPAPWQERPETSVEEFAELAKFLREEKEAGNIDVVTLREGVSRFEQRDLSRSWGLKVDPPFDKWYYASIIPVPARYYELYMETILRNLVGHRLPKVIRWLEQIDIFHTK